MSPFPPEPIDLSRFTGKATTLTANAYDDVLLPLERRTVILGGKAYMWSRQAPYAPLSLSPGYAPGDPRGCQGIETPQLHTPQITWPRVCVLPRAHGTRHLHKPELGHPGVWWGDPPRRQGSVVVVPSLDGTVNVTTGAEPDRTETLGRR